jgi:hypothetical protein
VENVEFAELLGFLGGIQWNFPLVPSAKAFFSAGNWKFG